MNAVSSLEQRIILNGRDVASSDLVFFGSLTLLAHLALLLATQWLSNQTISAYIPTDLNPNSGFQFALSAIVGLLLEIVLFFIGWLWIAGVVVLLNGRENVRALFGALGLCYLPAVLISAAVYIRLLIGVKEASFDAISKASTTEQLAAAFHQCQSSGFFRIMSLGSNLGYLLLLVCALEVVHRVCGISRLKAVITLGAYVGLLFTFNYFAS